MAIEGPIRELALSDVFQLLDLSRKTGVLSVGAETGSRTGTVWFDRGAVVDAHLAGSTGRIDRLLLRAGKVTEAHVNEAIRLQAADPGRRLGQILVDMGAVTEIDLRRQLRFQIEEVVFDLIQWKDGYFRFEEAPPPEKNSVPVRIPTESLLMEAARRIDEWSTLESKVPHMDVVPVLIGDSSDSGLLDLHPLEWEVLAEIDGARSVNEISRDLGQSDFDVAKIVFGLVTTGVVDILEDRVVAPEGPTEDTSLFEGLGSAHAALRDGHAAQALRTLGDLARHYPESAEVFLLTGQAQMALGRWADAAASLDRVIALDPISATAHYHLGFAMTRIGDLRRAADVWSTYLRLGDGDARQAEVVQRASEAAAALSAILEEQPA